MTTLLALLVGLLFALGTNLLLQRNLSRVVLGVALLGHGANLLLLLAGGRAGAPPLIGDDGTPALVGPEGGAGVADPLPQALALTAIVISFASLAFLLALAYRSQVLHREDLVQDDLEDRRVARARAAEDEVTIG